MSSKLDQLVKGAPPPAVSVPELAASVANEVPLSERTSINETPRSSPTPSDPMTLLPSSPPQIYLNLLILEASLRSQYLTLRARRRQNTFVLTLIFLWNAFFGYALFLRPRADIDGVHFRGGSPYWVVDTAEKMALIGGVTTLILFWGTGQWERGVRWPRRWLGTTNRGLRTMNCKVVVIKGPWWREMLSHFAFLLPYSLLFPTPGSSYHSIDQSAALAAEKRSSTHDPRARVRRRTEDGRDYREEDIAPGGDYIKLLLLPKPFSAAFRENWELYRTEYWDKENERRAELRKHVRARERELAKQEGGWLWWTGWRGWKQARGVQVPGRTPDLEKSHALHAHHGHHRTNSKRRSIIREVGDSRSSSRSSTPDLDERGRFLGERERRWSNSTAGSTSERRRKTIPGRPARLTQTPSTENQKGSIPGTPLADSESAMDQPG